MSLEFTSKLTCEAEAYLYWIHSPNATEMFKEGYIGVSTKPHNRFKAHRSCLRNLQRAKESYTEDFIKAFNSESLVMNIIDCGKLADMLHKEYILRPTENIGWNIAVGGKMNHVCAKYRHGGVSDQLMFQRFTRTLNTCKENGVYVDNNFNTDDGFKLFCLHIIDNSSEGVANKEVVFLDNNKGFVAGNFVLVDKSVHADHSQWLFYNGRWWSKKEACEYNGVDHKTADKRLTKYNMTREQAVGFEPYLSTCYKIVVLDGVECKYNTKLSSFGEDALIEMYEHYKSGKRGFKALCKSLGAESANMIRYFKRYNLNSEVDRRSKSFRGSEND